MKQTMGVIFKVILAATVASCIYGMVGCGSSGSGGGSTGTDALAPGGATSVNVLQLSSTTGAATILQFSATSTGSLTPTATLTPPSSLSATAITTDTSGQVYVGGYLSSQYEVMVYAAGATGAATPVRTILLPYYLNPQSMAVDASGQLYIVSGVDYIGVYSATANGSATPTRLITGSSTQLQNPVGIAADSSGNIYVTTEVIGNTGDTGALLEFATGTTGNVAPSRVITSSAVFYGVAADNSGNIYTVADTETVNSSSGAVTSTSATIEVFGPTSSGAATPSYTIGGSATDITFGGGLRRDSVGNIYMVNAAITNSSSGNSATFSLLGFGPTVTGNAPPAVDITSSLWNDAGSELGIN
jgi:hypothetical protein